MFLNVTQFVISIDKLRSCSGFEKSQFAQSTNHPKRVSILLLLDRATLVDLTVSFHIINNNYKIQPQWARSISIDYSSDFGWLLKISILLKNSYKVFKK